MLQYDDKDLVKSSKINNSKEELIEEIKQKGKIELKNSTIIIKDNELKKLKSSYKEIENFFENATKEKEIISSEAKEKINELNNLNDNLKKENIKLCFVFNKEI